MKVLLKVVLVLASVTMGYLACYFGWLTPVIDVIKGWFNIR